MFLEKILCHVESLAAFRSFAAFGDLIWLDGLSFIAEIVTDVGKHGGKFVILEKAAEGSY